MRLADDYRNGRRSLPPEIIELRERIGAATKNAEAVMNLFRMVDMSLVYEVVRMKHELDRLYGEWIAREAA